GQNSACGIIWIYDRDQLCSWADGAFELIQIELPIVFRAEMNFMHAAAGISCQSPDLAITGRDDNDVIARVKKRAGDDQVCLGSSNRHKHIRGCSACVQRGDALAQKAGSIDFRVVEREMGDSGGIFSGEQIAHIGAFDRTVGQVVFDRTLKLRLKVFEFKRLEIHGRKIIGGRCGCAPRTAYRETSALSGSLGVDDSSSCTPKLDLMCQMSRAYSRMVRSLEKYPVRATFRMAFLAQTSRCW